MLNLPAAVSMLLKLSPHRPVDVLQPDNSGASSCLDLRHRKHAARLESAPRRWPRSRTRRASPPLAAGTELPDHLSNCPWHGRKPARSGGPPGPPGCPGPPSGGCPKVRGHALRDRGQANDYPPRVWHNSAAARTPPSLERVAAASRPRGPRGAHTGPRKPCYGRPYGPPGAPGEVSHTGPSPAPGRGPIA